MQASILLFPTGFVKIKRPIAISDCQKALVQAFIQVLLSDPISERSKRGIFLSPWLFSSHKLFVHAFIDD